MVIETAEGFLELAKSREEKENLLRFACSAWNIACFESPKREQLLQGYIDEFKSSNNSSQQECDDLREDMEKLIGQKDILFPNESKRVIGSQITVINGQELIEISSTPFT